MKLRVVVLISLVAIILSGLSLFLYTNNRLSRNINRHVNALDKNPRDYGLDYETKSLKTSDGINIVSWYIPRQNAKAAIVLVHGFTSTKTGGKARMLDHAKYLSEAGYTVIMPDLRSFGESDGRKITFGIKEYQDVIAAFDYANSQPENKDKPVGIFGVSMGGATTIIAAGRSRKGDFIIISVPFKSIDSIFQFQLKKDNLPSVLFPFVQLSGVANFGLDYDQHSPEKEVKNIHVPILINGAREDEIVNSGDATILFELANSPKKYWQSEGGHDALKANPKEFKKQILTFLETYAVPSSKDK